ncbi:hypothetical protein RhiJN_01272 [Ceratobasidium sp. AG-Ba]|nr:hypothetical protein RhiJN_01272 [Ceratobasidium sp. AG-Ba]QRW02299.1 hypothetical protein RhiLY_01297 [Ceratobasidium sp. AG-Ba]
MTSHNSSPTAISVYGSEHPINNRRNVLFENVELQLSKSGSSAFDYKDGSGEWVRPRAVTEMYWYCEQGGDMNEWFVLKVSDFAHGTAAFVRLRPYEALGEATYNSNLAVPHNSSLRATISFDNGIDYYMVISEHLKVFNQYKGLPDAYKRSRSTVAFGEKTTLQINLGTGSCTPHDLCEFWSSMPDSDRRLQSFSWYEQNDDSGTEFIVLHVIGSSNFTAMQEWWVRLERDGSRDTAQISTNKDLVVPSGARKAREVMFGQGIPFAQVIDVLRDIPIGFDLATEDCWYYASTLAHRLSMEVHDDFFECPTEDLFEIWSGVRGAQSTINRVQLYREGSGEGSEYLILNVSTTPNDKYGLWVRFEMLDVLGSSMAGITRSYRRLLKKHPVMIADITFSGLRFGNVMQKMKMISRNMNNTSASQRGGLSKAASIVQALTTIEDVDHYWIEGDQVMFCTSYSSLRI